MSISPFRKQLILSGRFLPEEVGEFETRARESGDSLVEYLRENKILSDKALLELEAKAYGLEFWEAIPEECIFPDVVRRFGIQYLRGRIAVPLVDSDGHNRLALSRAEDIDSVEDFRFTLESDITPVLTSVPQITKAINAVFGEAQDGEVQEVLEDAEEIESDELAENDIEDLLDASSDAPFIKLVNMIMAQAVRAKASDIHIEPYQDTLRIRFRLDGILYDQYSIPRRLHAAIVSRIKIMAKLNIAEKRLPQDGRIALTLGGRQVDLRVSCLPTAYGERIVLRLLEKSARILDIHEIGLSESDLDQMKGLVTIPHGIILVTGPTGSGKTTSLYSVLNYINSPDKNILTIEDPIEYQLDGVGQMQVNSKIELTFAKGLRSIVRQDPDVILIGEIRDKETAEIAVQSALTGHLVFSTLHTNDAPSAVTRLIDMGVESFLLSSVIRAIVAQRLIRLLCPHCKEAFSPSVSELQYFGVSPEELNGNTLYRAKGCPECQNTGYKGRNAIYEIMEITDEIKGLIVQSADSNRIRKQAIQDGMKSLKRDGFLQVLAGMTTLTEVKRVTNL